MKRAQAAMEFLMTYGWAILVVLVAIGALAYFGVLSPDKFLPERCTGSAGMDCIDKASIDSTAETVSLAFKNNLGFQIDLTGGTITTDSATGGDCTSTTGTASVSGTAAVAIAAASDIKVANGENVVIVVTCTAFDAGRFKTDIYVPYENVDTGLAHKATFSITGKAAD